MGRWASWLVLSASIAAHAHAQSEPAPETATASAPADPFEIPETLPTTTTSPTPEPAATAAETPPAPEAPVTPPSSPHAAPTIPAAYDPEQAHPPTQEPDPVAELAITLNGVLSFSSTTTPSVATSADLVVGIGSRAWIGLGLSVAYNEQRTPAFPGSPEVRSVTTALAIPLILQFYLDNPRLGAAVPTLRVLLSGNWSESPRNPGPSLQYGGASAAVLAGITWMGASWIALRVLGGLQGGARAAYVGPVDIQVNVDVIAFVSAVIRL
jgi:hypothetical protein